VFGFQEQKGKFEMKFVDTEHEQFYNKMQEKYLDCWDVYHQSLFYVLGIDIDTRLNINKLFDFKEHGIKIEGLYAGFQTGGSTKVTRLAFNLWGGLVYDSDEDFDNNKVSEQYAVDNIFCCCYAPYLWEGIKLRYPNYCG